MLNTKRLKAEVGDVAVGEEAVTGWRREEGGERGGIGNKARVRIRVVWEAETRGIEKERDDYYERRT